MTAPGGRCQWERLVTLQGASSVPVWYRSDEDPGRRACDAFRALSRLNPLAGASVVGCLYLKRGDLVPQCVAMETQVVGRVGDVAVVELQRGEDDLPFEDLAVLRQGNAPGSQLVHEAIKLAVEILGRVVPKAVVWAV